MPLERILLIEGRQRGKFNKHSHIFHSISAAYMFSHLWKVFVVAYFIHIAIYTYVADAWTAYLASAEPKARRT